MKMARQTILAAPGVGYVHGTLGADELLLADRVANGEAYPGERLVRLPRRKPVRRGVPPWRTSLDGRLYCGTPDILERGLERRP